jgi:hypothetical protein
VGDSGNIVECIMKPYKSPFLDFGNLAHLLGMANPFHIPDRERDHRSPELVDWLKARAHEKRERRKERNARLVESGGLIAYRR